MPKQMPFVITISRQMGSGGSYIGQCIAEQLGIHYADHEIIRQAAEMLHVSEEVAESMDEKVDPIWLSLLRVFDRGRTELCYVPPANMPPHDKELQVAESTVITQIAENYSAVIVGRGGYHLLRNNPRHLAVFLYADIDFRLNRIQEIYNVSAVKAMKMIEKSDYDRQHYLFNVIGSDWTDSLQYHLSLNTSILGFSLTEKTIIDCLFTRLE